MGLSKIFGHSSKGTEYCRGFVDKHGQWNNGFYCPRWGGPDRQYCCGPDNHKYCCPKPEVTERLHDRHARPSSLIIGLGVGSLLLLMVVIFFSCYFCRCCWGYKRRKRIQVLSVTVPPPTSRPVRQTGQPAEYQVHYTVCPYLSEYMLPAPQYPMEDPPPYPGEPTVTLNEKPPIEQVAPPIVETEQRQVAWRDTGATYREASPLPVKHCESRPLLSAEKPAARRSLTETLEGSTSKSSWTSDTWPRAKRTRKHQAQRKDEMCSTFVSLYSSTESTDS